MAEGTYLCEHCGVSGAYFDSCTNLHVFYMAGALCTLVGSLFVILSYMCDPELRQHPSILIFM